MDPFHAMPYEQIKLGKSEKSEAEINEIIKEKTDFESLRSRLKSRAWSHWSPDFLEAMAALVIKLEDRIGNYDTIIGDDTSGRLPALILRRIINQKRTAENKERTNTFFVAGGRQTEANKEKIQEFIQSKKPEIENALLVMEYIQSGRAAQKLADILDEAGISFDVASVSVADPRDLYGISSVINKRENNLTGKLTYGKKGGAGLNVYKVRESGVDKAYGEASAHAIKNKNVDQKTINDARDDVKLISEEMVKLLDLPTKESIKETPEESEYDKKTEQEALEALLV